MGLIEWSDELSVKVEVIDEQHKILIAIINDLDQAIKVDSGKEEMEKILTRLIVFVQTHFDTEEHLMTQYHFPQEMMHKKEHFSLTVKIGMLYHQQIENQSSIAVEIRDFLNAWLLHHILVIDKQLGGYLSTRAQPAPA